MQCDYRDNWTPICFYDGLWGYAGEVYCFYHEKVVEGLIETTWRDPYYDEILQASA